MKEKITLPELAEAVSEQSGVSQSRCEEFVKELFATISDTLAKGENVKVKGLGTFKVTNVEQRKSVNVNTGAPVIIPEHRKVSYTPDKGLAEAVNAPFAMFEPVELADGVTEQMLQEADDASIQEAGPAQEESAPQTETIAISENILEPEPIAPLTPVADTELEPKPKQEETVADSTIVDTSSASDQVLYQEDDDDVEEDVAEEGADDKKEDVEDEADTTDVEDEEDTTYFTDRQKSHFRKGFWIGSLSAIALCALLLLGWIYLYPLISGQSAETLTQQKPKQELAAQANSTPVTPPAIVEETDPILPAEVAESIAVPTQPSDIAEVSATAQLNVDKEEKAAELPQKAEPKDYNDKITKKRYLTTMAREFYGNYNLWPYIYDYNAGLGHPDRIRPGTKIKVPTLKTLGIDPSDPVVVKQAKQRGIEIYAKYR